MNKKAAVAAFFICCSSCLSGQNPQKEQSVLDMFYKTMLNHSLF